MKRASETIRRKKQEIIAAWEETVRKEIPMAEKTERLVLLNIVPALIDDIAKVLERAREDLDLSNCPGFDEVIEESMDHGRHRATTAHFSAKKIVREHMALHRVIVMFLKKDKTYDQEVGLWLSLALETSMAYSVNSFNVSLQEMREKLIATLAHDIRNPLAAANLGLNSIRHEDSKDRFLKINKMAGANVRKAIDLVEELLDAISVQSGEGILMDFSEYDILEDVKLVTSEAAGGCSNQILVNHPEEEVTGIFASTAIRRILENLITNAVKYGAPEEPITVNLRDVGKKVVLQVHNHGNSISKEDRKDIFDFLSHSEKDSPTNLKSWGIGLAFVKMAAEAHGGHVEIESEEGKGTTFSVVLQKYSTSPGKKRAQLNSVG